MTHTQSARQLTSFQPLSTWPEQQEEKHEKQKRLWVKTEK